MEDEYRDLYDREGQFVGKSIKRGLPIPEGLYHKVVHVWVYNIEKEILVQKRAPHLNWYPDKWATTTGSVLSGNQDYKKEAERELQEELGLYLPIEYQKDLIIGQSICTIYMGIMAQSQIKTVVMNDEVTEVKWMSMSEIKTCRDNDTFAQYPEELFTFVFGKI